MHAALLSSIGWNELDWADVMNLLTTADNGFADESRTPLDEAREDRITNEAIVDAYGPEEQAIGWYYYLQDRLPLSFTARCVNERAASPLRIGEVVEVRGLAPEDECEHDMLAWIRWHDRDMAVPLAQLLPVNADDDANEALADWRYWVGRGYEFG